MDCSNWMAVIFSAISAFAVTLSTIIAGKALKSSNETSKRSLETSKRSLETSKQSLETSKQSLETAKLSQETKKQYMQFVVFTECTRRFHEIKLHLREEDSKEDKDYYRRLYIDLCSEEYFLNKKGYFYEELWEIWSKGMKLNVKDNQDYKEIWETDKEYYDEKFREFFDSFFEQDNTL